MSKKVPEKKDRFFLIAVLFVCTLIVYPLIGKGMYPFHDEPNIAHLYQMIRALLEHQIPPRWIADASYNYGGPYFNYFYHLPFYVGSFFYIVLGFNLISSFKAVIALSVYLSGLFFYKLMRKFFDPLISFSSTVLYLFTPYRAVDIFVRGAIGEMWGFVFMPLIFYFMLRLIDDKSRKNVAFLSMALGGFVITHNSSVFMFLPFAAIFALIVSFISKETKQNLKYLFLSLMGGLGLSAYYWLPVIFEKNYIKPGSPFNPIDHFPFIKQLIIPFWGYGASVWGPGDGMSFQIGVVNLVVIVIAIILLAIKIRNKKTLNPLFYFSFISFFIAVFFMNIRSLPLWNIMPLASYIQFPWRLLILTTFFSSILSGYVFKFISGRLRILPVLFALVAVVITWNYFKPEKILNVNDDYYLRRFYINIDSGGRTPILSEVYHNNTEDYLPVTIWNSEAPTSLPKSKVESDGGKLQFTEVSSTKYLIRIQTSENTKVTLHSYYFPGWVATVDGEKVKISPQSPYGDMAISVPEGTHEVIFQFKNTPVRLFANVTSLVTIIVVTFLFVGPKSGLKV
jgi:hypothetical protein